MRNRLFDLEELDFKFERGSGWDDIPRSGFTVRQFTGTNQGGLTTFLHELQAFGPSLDDTIEREGNSLSAIHGRVKDGTIRERPVVVHFHGGRCGWRLAFPFRHGTKDETRVGLFGFFVAVQKVFDKVVPVLLDAFNDSRRALLQYFVERRSVRAENGTRVGGGRSAERFRKGLEDNFEFVVFQQSLEVALSTDLHGQVGTQGVERHFVVVVGHWRFARQQTRRGGGRREGGTTQASRRPGTDRGSKECTGG